MYVTSFIVKHFKPFSLSNIKTLELTPNQQLQIFIGDNGSGKSSLLNEIVPFAAVKPMYAKHGYKQINLVHNEDEYSLTSDFSISGGAHSFKKNGTELNISGIAGIQNELVLHHLGISTLVHDITHYSYHMCSMSKTERKSLLLSINPVDLSLVLDKHKAIWTKIRECKSNLSLLYKKKQEIEIQLLDEDLLNRNIVLKNDISKQAGLLSSEIYHLRQLIQEDEEKLLQFGIIDFDISQVKKTCNSINVFLTECRDIVNRDTESIQHVVDTTRNTTMCLQVELSQLQDKVMSLSEEIRKYSQHIVDMGEVENKDSLILHISNLEKSKIPVDINLPYIPEEQYYKHIELINNIISLLCQYFSRFKRFVVTPIQVAKISKCTTKIQMKVSSYEKSLATNKEQLQELEKELVQFPVHKILHKVCNECEYFSHFEQQTRHIRDKIVALRKNVVHYEKLYTRYNKALLRLMELDVNVEQMQFLVNDLKLCLSQTIFTSLNTNLLSVLSGDINQTICYLKDVVEQAPKVYENEKIEKQLTMLKDRLVYLESSNTPSVDFLKEIATIKQQELSHLYSQIDTLETQIFSQNTTLKKYEEYLSHKTKLANVESQLREFTEYICLKARIKFHKLLLDDKTYTLNSIQITLTELENTLKSQDILSGRLKDTLLTIEDIEKLKSDLQIIEVGLSPYSGFPHQNMIDYVNILIHNANTVLSTVWTYPLQLIPLTMDSPLDGTFSILVDDIVVPDISKLSKAQQAIVNLAWTFAFIISMKLTNYPIFLDECDDGFDPTHKTRLLEWLKSLIDNGYVSQMFLVHHEAANFTFFSNSEVLALMSNNITQCDNINKHVVFS